MLTKVHTVAAGFENQIFDQDQDNKQFETEASASRADVRI